MSEKSYRLLEQFSYATNAIKDKIPMKLHKTFDDTYYSVYGDRKKCLSINQIIAMSFYESDTLTSFVKEFIENPKQGKEIYKKYFNNYKTKITFEVSGEINDILIAKAKERGMSKTQYVSRLITLIALSD